MGLCLLVEDPAAYRRRLTAKTSLLAAEHFGNFHQQLGQGLMLNRRQNSETWWAGQKFEPDFKAIRDNLYRAVQFHFLKIYFPQRLPKGSSAAASASISSLMASGGARVLGVDPSKNYTEIAANNAVSGARFAVMPVGAPGGVFISLEPSFFWLSLWLGDADRPFTVFTEYREKRFGVTPSLGQMVAAFYALGFYVSALQSLRPDPGFIRSDPRGWHFAEFPLWHLFELVAKNA